MTTPPRPLVCWLDQYGVAWCRFMHVTSGVCCSPLIATIPPPLETGRCSKRATHAQRQVCPTAQRGIYRPAGPKFWWRQPFAAGFRYGPPPLSMGLPLLSLAVALRTSRFIGQKTKKRFDFFLVVFSRNLKNSRCCVTCPACFNSLGVTHRLLPGYRNRDGRTFSPLGRDAPVCMQRVATIGKINVGIFCKTRRHQAKDRCGPSGVCLLGARNSHSPACGILPPRRQRALCIAVAKRNWGAGQ